MTFSFVQTGEFQGGEEMIYRLWLDQSLSSLLEVY